MTNAKKTISILGLAIASIGAFVFSRKAIRLNDTAKTLSIVPNLDPKNLKVSSSIVKIPIDIKVSNASDRELKLWIRSVKLMQKTETVDETEIAFSEPNDTRYIIDPNSDPVLDPIVIQIPLTNLISLFNITKIWTVFSDPSVLLPKGLFLITRFEANGLALSDTTDLT